MVHVNKYLSRGSKEHVVFITIFAGSLESAYSLILGSHEIWGKGGGDTLALL